MEKKKCTAIVLAAGQGTRMGTATQKQYLKINQKTVLSYSLEVFQHSSLIDEIILVVGDNQQSYCMKEYIEKGSFSKIEKVVVGGNERYDSVWNGLQVASDEGYVFIHDGARPFIDQEMIHRLYETVKIHHACILGMPVKDTIKVVNEEGFAIKTPERKSLWMIQTPQVFDMPLIKDAYHKMKAQKCVGITDDAMVVEQVLKHPVKIVEGSYENIKITTPEDLEIAEIFCKKKNENLEN